MASSDKKTIKGQRRWRPAPRPEWVSKLNDEARCFDLPRLLPLDAPSLIDAARAGCGLEDFGDDDWREPFETLCRALDDEARLNLTGRLMARNDILAWLDLRLRVQALCAERPQVPDAAVDQPVFILGLPRSGTSILYELMASASAEALRVPLTWEALFPLAEDEAAARRRGDAIFTQWSRVAPEFATMHEMGGDIPCECGLLMAPSFRGDHIASNYQIPSYAGWLAAADIAPAYAYHRRMLQVLQSRRGAGRWLLKAPNHLAFLPQLFAEYPDARVIQTHRDPLKCMASALDLLGTLYWIRSDQEFESSAFEDLILGEATAARLMNALELRRSKSIPSPQCMDVRYQDLMDAPVDTIGAIHEFLGLDFGAKQAKAVEDYLRHKPKDKFGQHEYKPLDDEQRERERGFFAEYQRHFDIPDEA